MVKIDTLYISDQDGSNIIPFGGADNCIAYIGYSPGVESSHNTQQQQQQQFVLKNNRMTGLSRKWLQNKSRRDKTNTGPRFVAFRSRS